MKEDVEQIIKDFARWDRTQRAAQKLEDDIVHQQLKEAMKGKRLVIELKTES